MVVTTITPFADFAPQIEAAAASFNTVMLSIVLGLRVLIEASTGKPSTIRSGDLFEATNVERPRISNEMLPSASVVAARPAAAPINLSPIFDEGCAR